MGATVAIFHSDSSNGLGGRGRRNAFSSPNSLARLPSRFRNGLCGIFSIIKTDAAAQKAEKLINQDCTATKSNEKWLTGIIEIPCSGAKLYLAPVFDCYYGIYRWISRGYKPSGGICCIAFENLYKKTGATGMILHSDRGIQYINEMFR